MSAELIDIAAAGRIANEGDPEDVVCVTRRWLKQAAFEILDGRLAMDKVVKALDLKPPKGR